MTTAVTRFGATFGLALLLVSTTWPTPQSRAGVERNTDLVQYCAPADSWDIPRLFCGRAEG